jgi:hypothetical protein
MYEKRNSSGAFVLLLLLDFQNLLSYKWYKLLWEIICAVKICSLDVANDASDVRVIGG